MNKRAILLFLILLTTGTSHVLATPLTTGADFLLMTTGARPDGMGQAFSAVADDINTLSFNPAGLANIRMPEIGYGHESFIADIGYDFIGMALPVGDMGVLGLGYLGMGTAPFNSTANSSAESSSVQDMALIGGWGKSFYDLHVGAAVKYISRKIDTVQGSGLGFDVGLRYRILPTFTLAASGMNIGPGIKMASSEPLPTAINVGLAWTAVELPMHTLNIAADVNYNVITNTERAGFGAEYWFRNEFALRAGYLTNSDDEGFSCGAGVQVSFVQLDYAFEPYNLLGSVHRFSGIVRWDGPWMSGGEPNSPKYVSTVQTPQALEIRWEKSRGPVQAYEVIIQPLDGRPAIVSPPVVNPIYYFKGYDQETLYKISVRAIGIGGGRSFPSKPDYLVTESVDESVQNIYNTKSNVTDMSVPHGVTGKVDTVGLQLSWPETDDPDTVGYNLYRKSPNGRVEKATLEPKHSNKVWVTDTSGLQGWEWLATSVNRDGKEKVLGTYLWYPSTRQLDALFEKPSLKLNVSPQTDRKVYVDWDSDPDAVGYTLLFSRESDGVYEFYQDINKTDTNLLMRIAGDRNHYYFIIVPRDSSGHWLKRSNEAELQFLVQNPDDDNVIKP